LGGADSKTLFCITAAASAAQQASLTATGKIETVRAESPRAETSKGHVPSSSA
jgi:hypothetical protein